MTKLHLGCGTVHLDGYINIDIRYLPGVDVVDNAKYLRRYKESSVDEIYACHVLEHFNRWEARSVLSRWCEVLRDGGVLMVSVPDFDAVAARYQKTGDLLELIGLLYGGQDYPENFHHYCWNFDTLTSELRRCGFTRVERFDWELTDHAGVDDYSKAYLPHMDEGGLLMSLNLRATK